MIEATLLTWMELAAEIKAGERVVFVAPFEIFAQNLIIQPGETGTVAENGLNEMHCGIEIRPDNPEIRKVLDQWEGNIHLGSHLDAGADPSNPEDDRVQAWHADSPLARLTYKLDGEAVNFAEFIAVNEFDETELAAIKALKPGESMTFGGGAMPITTLRVYGTTDESVAPDDLEIAALAALHHWHSNKRNFDRQEPEYLALLRRALAARHCMPHQLARRGLSNDKLVADALAARSGNQ